MGNMEEEVIQDEIIEFLIKNEKSTLRKILDGVPRKRINVDKVFKKMLKQKAFKVETNMNHPQTDVYSIDIKSIWMDKSLLTLLKFPDRVNYNVIAEKTRNRITKKQKFRIYEMAMDGIFTMLDTAKILFWYSSDVNTITVGNAARSKLKGIRNEIADIIDLVEKFDEEIGKMLKTAVSTKLFSDVRFQT